LTAIREVRPILAAQWRYRSFIWSLVTRDFHSRYLNSILGALWSVLNPLSTILVYTLIFSEVMGSKIPNLNNAFGYSIYLCAGLLPWNYFVETLTRCQGVFLEQANLLKKISFPRATLPSYVLLSSTINFGIVYALFLVFLILSHNLPGPALLAIFPLLIIQQALALGLGVCLGTLNVFFRDIGHSLGIVIQFWFWLTPVVYVIKAVPQRYQWLLAVNPMLPVVQAFQGIFLYGRLPHWLTLLPSVFWALGFLALGFFTFARLNKEMVDEL
jgi:lipopolysaccharide transport system permease protein